MEKLEDFALLEPIFRGVGITPNWLHALSVGYTKVYNNYGVVNYYIEDGICMVNSGTINNEKFTKSMIVDIMKLIEKHKKIIVYSERDELIRWAYDHGFIRDFKNNLYIRM